MSMRVDRRQLLQTVALGASSALLPIQSMSQEQAKIIVVGGGFGGATAALTLRALLPAASITLIEMNATYTACPFSNLVIGGTRDLSAQNFSYQDIAARGVNVIINVAHEIDPVAQTIKVGEDTTLLYDKLILSPGISFRWSALAGYDEAASQAMPHAWKAGAQTVLLKQKLETLADGEIVLMSVPTAPYRCPPGPYERASLIAHYLKTQKPRSKLIILDGKDRFSKMHLFQDAWAENYSDHLEWRSASNDGIVSSVSPDTMSINTDFETFQSTAINIIPPQKAGEIADRAGVTDATGWCPIDPLNFESSLQKNIHVIGDATIAAPMPKSAFSANLQGKICAVAIARELSGLAPEPTVLANTCYSYTTPDEAISIAGVYTNSGPQLSSIPNAGGISPRDAGKSERAAEAAQAAHWFDTITSEAFG